MQIENHSSIINEYVQPNHLVHDKVQHLWTVEYEPLDHIPVIQGSLHGTIYDGLMRTGFEVLEDGRVLGLVNGLLIAESGVIILIYDQKPGYENYLRVSYESGIVEILTKNFWLQEGF